MVVEKEVFICFEVSKRREVVSITQYKYVTYNKDMTLDNYSDIVVSQQIYIYIYIYRMFLLDLR
jgi:hypothetical protein